MAISEIKITCDKNGRRLAYRWARSQVRWFRMGLAEADLAIATGAGVDVSGDPNYLASGCRGVVNNLRVVA